MDTSILPTLADAGRLLAGVVALAGAAAVVRFTLRIRGARVARRSPALTRGRLARRDGTA